jgi:hypothetical protein
VIQAALEIAQEHAQILEIVTHSTDLSKLNYHEPLDIITDKVVKL